MSNLLEKFFNTKKECEWNLLNDEQQTQLIIEFEIWHKKFIKCLNCEFIACENHEKCLKSN